MPCAVVRHDRSALGALVLDEKEPSSEMTPHRASMDTEGSSAPEKVGSQYPPLQAKGFEPSTPTQQLPAPERSQLGAIIRLRPCLRIAFDACCRATSKNGPSGGPMVPPARHFAKGGAKGEARG